MSDTASEDIGTPGELPGQYEYAPDGALRWPAPDRDSPQLGQLSGRFIPEERLGALLRMEGHQGRSEDEVKRLTGVEIKRPRRWHKIFERMGILYPGEGSTRLARLGRLLRDASDPNGLRLLIGREAVSVLMRYQFDNPVERSLPEGCDVHPYYIILRAASLLDWRIHWDEVNREFMRITKDSELDDVVQRIFAARKDATYSSFIGTASNDAGLLRARTHPAEAIAPERKTPEGQLRDQRMTPFLKRVSFSELLLESPGASGGGYWTVRPEFRDVIRVATAKMPQDKRFTSEQEWIDWFCEGTLSTETYYTPPPLSVAVPVAALTLVHLKTALEKYEPELAFTDELLASLVAAIRSGDGRNFVILRGVSGTGKSRLVAAIAKVVYDTGTVDMPNLTIIEVRPDWVDGAPLLGHYDPIRSCYIRQRFLDALLAAQAALRADPANPAPIFVCLDEMNLARVEYYLADCLSAMESGNPIPLDTRDDASLPGTVIWPSNLFLFGTVNIDESTLRISDKVLDRAQVIDTGNIDLIPQLEKWLSTTKALDTAERDRVRQKIGSVWSILREVDAHFGFRTARTIVRFLDEGKVSSGGVLSLDDAIDAQLMQKILVKLRGEGERWALVLEELQTAVGDLTGRKRTLATLERMKRDLEHTGSFQFWN